MGLGIVVLYSTRTGLSGQFEIRTYRFLFVLRGEEELLAFGAPAR